MSLIEALSRKACQVLNENPARVEDDINNIKQWILKQPHLKARIEDKWILNFLRGCKFSLEKTKYKIDKYYSLRNVLPQMYGNRDPLLPEIQDILKCGFCLPFLKTDGEDGQRIILLRCKTIDFTKIGPELFLKVYTIIMDILLYQDDNFLIGGFCVLFDLEGGNINHLLNIDLNLFRKFLRGLQDAYPVRPQSIHVVNVTPLFETIVGISKHFFNKKISDRFFIYSSSGKDEFNKMFPKCILPKEYEGESATLSEITEYWKNKVESYRDWLIEDMKYGCDETKRPRSTNQNDLFGVDGSFKALNID